MDEIFLYFVSGYIFTYIFNFIVSNKNPKDYQHMIVKSILLGYVLVLFYHIVPSISDDNQYVDISLFLVLCVLASYLAARFYVSDCMRKLCRKLRIKNTVNEYIWNDIKDNSNKPLWIRVISIEQDFEIFGQLVLFEQFQRKPIIILDRYERKTLKKKKVIEDFDNDITRRIVIDTEKCDRIELIYDKDSVNIKRY